MRYAVIENETPVRKGLIDSMKRLRPEWELAFESETIADTVRQLASGTVPDIMFMDIELDDGTSFEIFKQTETVVPVIFVTAYSQYAVRAFKENSVHYLLKPAMDSDLEEAITKFEETGRFKCDVNYVSLQNDLKRNSVRPRRILITVGDCYKSIPIDEIAWLEAEDKSVYACTFDGHRYCTDFRSLREVLPALNFDDFFQLSRSLIGNIRAISKVSRHFKGRFKVLLKTNVMEIGTVVSTERRDSFIQWFGWMPTAR